MLKNYLKIAFRIIKRHKGYSFTNIAGLAIGMACTILILLWVQYELSFDRFHEDAGQIYRVSARYEEPDDFGIYLPGPLAAHLKEEYPEIIDSTSYKPWRRKLAVEDKSFFSRGSYVDPSFFKIFTFPLVKGDPETVFSDPYSIVITEDLAERFFGHEDPVGKTITYYPFWDGVDLKVTGVIGNIPRNSHLQFDFLIPYEIGFDGMRIWTNNAVHTYVRLNENTDFQDVSRKISDVAKRHRLNCNYVLFLQPLKRVYLYALEGGGRITYIYIFSAMAIIILLIACINFMNLSTARAEKRFKEIGVKKVLGSSRLQLITQLLSESILLSFLALFFAVLLAEMLTPSVNTLLGTQLKLRFSPMWMLGFVGIAMITGVFAGSYPAFYLSAFHPVAVLKGQFSLISVLRGKLGRKSTARSQGAVLRRILVVVQFSLSIFFIICVMVITRQLDYIRNIDLRFEKENLLVVEETGGLRKNAQIVKNELLRNPDIRNVAVSQFNLVEWESTMTNQHLSWTGKTRNYDFFMGQNFVDYDFLDTLNIEMVQGRFFSREFPSDATEACVVNEAAVKAMRMENPLGKKCIFNPGTSYERTKTIIGVIRDFNTESLHKEIRPFIWEFTDTGGYLCIRLRGRDIPATIKFIGNKIKEFVPDDPFSYYFLEDKINSLYQPEQLTGSLTRYITLLAVFICCLGLFGLATFIAEKKTKEIGIRKVLGASVSNIMLLLSKRLIRWVLISNIIAWPVAYYAMNRWLQNFAYRISIELWMFMLAAGLALLVALITVSYQCIKAALANPVESLRYE
ncbi:MAG: ABC transporter permease [Acidobacteriota bacterium]